MNHTFHQALYLRRGRRVALLLAGLPFIRMVGLNGSVARGEAKPTSDIDYLIITSPGRLYTVRFFVTILVHALGVRRYGPHVAGRICLNRYQTTRQLEIRPHNDYHARVFSELIPLIDIDDTYTAYQVANQWMVSFDQTVTTAKHRPSRTALFSQITRRSSEWLLGGRFGNRLERLFKTQQLAKIHTNPLTSRYPDRIHVSDDVLLFHPPAVGEIDDDLARWDAAASAYDMLQGRLGDPFRRLVLDPTLFELIGPVTNQRVLDAGCGNGYLTNLLAEHGATVTGVDGSAVLVARAAQNFPQRDFRIADLRRPLPFPNQTFDLVVSSMVLQDLADPQQAMQEFRRILKPNGRVIVAVSHPCFAYPVGVTKRGLWRRLTGQPAVMHMTNYHDARRTVIPIQGLNQTNPTVRYHRTLADYWGIFRAGGFTVSQLREPTAAVARSNARSQIANLEQIFPTPTIPIVLVLELRLAI